MSMDDLAQLRKEYARHALDESDVDLNPLVQFTQWFQEAINAQLLEPNAMVLASATPDGRPSARVVLLKEYDNHGFVFFTNYEGRKSSELMQNPNAALLFFWAELERQVRIEGTIEKTSRHESEDYFKIRPLESQLGAWASKQSSVIPSRNVLEQKVADLRSLYANKEFLCHRSGEDFDCSRTHTSSGRGGRIGFTMNQVHTRGRRLGNRTPFPMRNLSSG